MERSEILGLLLLVGLFFAAVLVAKSLVRGTKLRTVPAEHKEITGEYTLTLFGGTYSNDLETFAFLDKEDDRYVFEAHAPEFRFSTEKKVSAQVALQKAEEFVSKHPSFHRHLTSKILDDKGATIGYEIRPLYLPEAFGVSDFLEVSYTLKDNKVSVNITLPASIEKIQNPQSGAQQVIASVHIGGDPFFSFPDLGSGLHSSHTLFGRGMFNQIPIISIIFMLCFYIPFYFRAIPRSYIRTQDGFRSFFTSNQSVLFDFECPECPGRNCYLLVRNDFHV